MTAQRTITSMVALAPNTSETSPWDVLDTFPKLHSRAREAKPRFCTEAPHSKSLDRVEIWLTIFESRVGLESFTRDPIGYKGSEWSLYEYAKANCLMNIDPTGEDIYVESGNNTINPVNNYIHQNVCVDAWLSCNPPMHYGKFCFSFGLDLGSCCGKVYESEPVPWADVVRRSSTTCEEDGEFLRKIMIHVDHISPYNLFTRNCRHFSHSWFETAPGKKFVRKCVKWYQYMNTATCIEYKMVEE